MAHETFIHHKKGADKVVLFIHGFLGSPEHFEKFIESTPDNVSVYNILLEGHGGSVRDFARASMKKWKAQVDSVVSELCEKYGEIIIVAHSMGTFFAMESAIKYPDKGKKLMLLQTPLKIGVKKEATINTIKSLFNLFPDDKVAKAYKESHSVELTFRFWEYIGWIPRYIELFKESKLARDTILRLLVPCYIFQAKNDELVSLKSVKYIPQNTFIALNILENSAHFIYSEENFLKMKNCFLKLL